MPAPEHRLQDECGRASVVVVDARWEGRTIPGRRSRHHRAPRLIGQLTRGYGVRDRQDAGALPVGPFLSEEGRVGCLAGIQKDERLKDGRSILVVEGVERFRIDDGIESEALYFEALVTPFPDASVVDIAALVQRREASIELFQSVVDSLAQAPEHLPDLAPESEVSFLLAQTIQVDPLWHQSLLELQDESARLAILDRVFRAALS
jgi:Lon protease-like protein